MTKGQKKITKVMHEFKAGDLRSSSGEAVTNPKQAVAIALSEARQVTAKVRRRPQGSGAFTDAEMTRGYRSH